MRKFSIFNFQFLIKKILSSWFTVHSFQGGQSLIELMIAVGLAGLLLPALVTGFYASQGGRAQQDQRIAATNLARETQEAVRVARDKDWSLFSTDGQYYPTNNGITWTLTQGTESPRSDGFTRTVQVDSCYRDTNGLGAITACAPSSQPVGSVIDPSTKKVIVTVSWQNPLPNTVTTTEYLTRFTNLTYPETYKSDFDKGTTGSTTQTVLDNPVTGDGSVKLAAGGGGTDWCQPLSGIKATYSLGGVPVAISATTLTGNDEIFATTGVNNSGFVATELTVSQDGNYTIGNPDTNNLHGGIEAFGIYSDSNYVYYNERSSHNHVVQITQNGNPPKSGNLSTDYGHFDPLSGNADGKSVYVAQIAGNDVGFAIAGNTLYTFDLSSLKDCNNNTVSTNRSGCRKQLGSKGLNGSGSGQKVIVVGTKAYVASSSPSNQLQIFDVSDPTHIGSPTSVPLGSGAGVDLAVDPAGKYAYVITDEPAGTNAFFIVDLLHSNTSYPYSLQTGMQHPKGIFIPANSNRAIIVGSGTSNLYQVYTLNGTSASSCVPNGGITPTGVTSINAVSGVTQASGNVYSYITTGTNSTASFEIIQGGGGGTGNNYQTSGTFKSQIVDLGAKAQTNKSVVLNSFTADYQLNGEPTPQIYVGLVPGPCVGATFSSYSGPYTLPSSGSVQTLPIGGSGGYQNPGQCLQYKVAFTSDGNNTPVFQDITFNFSP